MDTANEQEHRRHWRWAWLSALQAFADADTQLARWTNPEERNPAYSFTECMCSYFDDAYMSEDQAYERRIEAGYLRPDEVAAVADFHAMAVSYQPPGEDWSANEAILVDPAWQNVVCAAQDAQQRLLQLLDNDERATLTLPLEWEENNGVFRSMGPGSTPRN